MPPEQIPALPIDEVLPEKPAKGGAGNKPRFRLGRALLILLAAHALAALLYVLFIAVPALTGLLSALGWLLMCLPTLVAAFLFGTPLLGGERGHLGKKLLILLFIILNFFLSVVYMSLLGRLFV